MCMCAFVPVCLSVKPARYHTGKNHLRILLEIIFGVSRGVVGILGVTTQRRHAKFAVICVIWRQIAPTCMDTSRLSF